MRMRLSVAVSSVAAMNNRRPGERQGTQVAAEKVGRNEPCPCGSGKKYKKCHGEAA